VLGIIAVAQKAIKPYVNSLAMYEITAIQLYTRKIILVLNSKPPPNKKQFPPSQVPNGSPNVFCALLFF
jgi:hypothetical protein